MYVTGAKGCGSGQDGVRCLGKAPETVEAAPQWNDAAAVAARHAELVVQRVDAACGSE